MYRVLCAAAVMLFVGLAPARARASDSPGIAALETHRQGRTTLKAVENRYFLKEERFEVAPGFGYVPNNPFARRYTGQVTFGYHFAETVSAQAQIGFSPDLGESDLKGLVDVLLQRAHDASTSSSDAFQQPLDKVVLGANFGAAWAPLYGKINLFGETVLNFDFYGFAGVGMVSKQNYNAVYDEGVDITIPGADIVELKQLGNEVKVGPALGVGQNYFVTQTVSFKIDVRSALYIDQKAQYDPAIPPDGSRLYNNFTASFGVGFFFPKMKPRLYSF